jgi:ubiquinone/menaquinone biosynthesis C-methylase UbiE
MADDPYNWDARVDAWEKVAATDTFGALRDRVVSEAAPRRSDRVLDLGAGTGLVTLALAPLAANMTALDISRRMLERLDARAAADGVTNVDLVAGDMRSLPFDDETFDVVVSNYAFHHLDDPGKELSLSEARRVLVPGGRLVVCDMMFSLSLQPRDRRLILYKLRALAARGPAGLLRIVRNAGRVATGRWERPASPETWARLLTERHFADVRIELLKEEAGLATASRPLVSEPAERLRPAGTEYSSANTYAATTRASRSVISSSRLEGHRSGSPSSSNSGSLRNPPDFHIKPRVRRI